MEDTKTEEMVGQNKAQEFLFLREKQRVVVKYGQ